METATLPAPPARPDVAPRCAVCETPLGEGEYCPGCGERRVGAHDYRLSTLLGDVLRDVTSVDGRVLRSIRSLLTVPGDLTVAYFDGRRGLYTKPLSLFVALNVVFFFIVPHTGLMRLSYADYVEQGSHARRLLQHAAAAHLSPQAYAARFDARLGSLKQSTLLYLIPTFAITVQLTNLVTARGRRRYAVEHVIFSIHTVTFFIVASILVLMPSMFALIIAFQILGQWTPLGGTLGRALDGSIATAIVFSGVVGWYLKHASMRYYGDSTVAAVARSIVLTTAYFGIIQLFRTAMFWAALWTA